MEAEAHRGSQRGKLRHGVRLALLFPEWNRPCAVCEKYIWQDKNPGRVQRRADGEPVERKNDSIPLRCIECPKVPQWAKEQNKDWRELRALAVEDITPENEEALRHYTECRAVGAFPDDDIVRLCAGVIRPIEDEAARAPAERQTVATTGLIQAIHILLRRVR